ncbi:MAG: hypothetical protein RLZZ15_1257 [Verrucomicrobiota bacterium]|jgi:hypothetical protein
MNRPRRLFRFLFLALLALVGAAAARAQSVRWEPSDSASGAVQLVFEDCGPDGTPELPNVPGVSFQLLGQSSSTNVVNFDVRRTVSYVYSVRSRQNAPVQIPAFTVKTTKGPQRVAAFDVGAPTATVASSLASSKLLPARTAVWAGEVFALGYELTAARRVNPQIQPNFDWTPGPLTVEDWSKPDVTEDSAGGERRVRVAFRTRAFVAKPNTFKLEAASHALSVQTGTIGAGFFTQARMEPITVTSDQPTLEVRPLPPAPPEFTGAVGQFQLVSKVVPQKAAPGEPITWTLELSGTGNWPAIEGLPTREVSKDFQVVQPKAKRTNAEGKLFESTLAEDVVLVPAKPGTYALGPVKLAYFDPKTGAYHTLTAPRTVVTVVAPDAPKLFQPPGGNSADDARGPASPEAKIETQKSKAQVPAPPAILPRDPLPGSEVAAAPLSTRSVVLLAFAPFAIVVAVWAAFAHRRAQLTDPLRPQREARLRLAQTIRAIQSTPHTAAPLSGGSSGSALSSELSALGSPLLHAWQRDTATLWQLAHAAPGASALTDAAWSALWAECDRALYGAKPELPSDWCARAEAALAAKRLPGANPLRALLPRNLFPFAALLAVALLAPAVALRAADAAGSSLKSQISNYPAADAYRAGDFASAEKSWRTAVAKNPADWIARHNLALALAQQDRAGEAAAHAGAAFVQRPGHPSVRWHLALAHEKAGFVPAPLAPFVRHEPAAEFARHHSPAQWQRLLVAGAALAALAVIGLLAWSYGRRPRALALASGAVLVLAVVAVAVSALGWRAYGAAADARAVVVWRAATLRSIPTDADTTQKTTALAPGSVAVADKTFLTWTRLAFESGQTGWVHTDDLVGLWR